MGLDVEQGTETGKREAIAALVEESFKGLGSGTTGSQISLGHTKHYSKMSPGTQPNSSPTTPVTPTSPLGSPKVSFVSLCDDPMFRIFDKFSEDEFETEIQSEDERETRGTLSPEEVYRAACEDLNVTPISYYIRHVNDSHLNLNYRCMGPKAIEAVAISLVGSTMVNTLELEDNWIEAEGLRYLMEMLSENCYIQDLNLARNNLRTKGAAVFSKMLPHNISLKSINLSRNHFRDNDAEYFADAFASNFRVTHLDLSNNEFGEKGGEELGQLIAYSESLVQLDISWNQIQLRGAMAISAGLRLNMMLKVLNLANNGFGNEGALALGEALRHNSYLLELNLKNNHIGIEGVSMLCRGLEVNDTLRVLDLLVSGLKLSLSYQLADNPLKVEAAFILLAVLKKNPKSPMYWFSLKFTRQVVYTGRTMELNAFVAVAVLDCAGQCVTGGWGDRGVVGEAGDSMWTGALVGLGLSRCPHLQNVIVNEAFMDQLRSMKEERSRLIFITAGLGSAFNKKLLRRTFPMKVIQDFLEKRKLRLLDFFKNMDKEGNMKVSVSDFRKALQRYQIPLDRVQIEELFSKIDKDNVGQVDYRNLVDTRKQMVQEQRREQRKAESQQRMERRKSDHLLNSFRGAVEAVRPGSSSITSSSHRLPDLHPQDSLGSSSDAPLSPWRRPEGADSSRYSLPSLSRERLHHPLSVAHPGPAHSVSLCRLPADPRNSLVSRPDLVPNPGPRRAPRPSTTSNLIGKPAPPVASGQLTALTGQRKPHRERERERERERR
ncbi:uncharacterized protein LOC121849693 [Callorhinchus milii]|uniref:uncharacterized protein LOC121849693 n=1 Tax=Callorhinchus milii TaxID=7868 RepID=UPI001C3FF497|nr:uncharacterized protein LOC121849693 [Callorhinchus milii]